MERINIEDARIRVVFYWLDNYHYKLFDSDILDLINRAKDAL